VKTVMQTLADIQARLNAPKDQRNNFGKYNYRKAEDIIAAYKGLKVEGASLVMSDSMSVVGQQIFLTATVRFTFEGETVEATGCAMHALTKKGMDEAQITGAASSYARKYALCGLFAIDDSEHDPDGKDNSEKPQQRKPDPKPSQQQAQPTPEERMRRMDAALKKCDDANALNELWNSDNFKAAYKAIPDHLRKQLDLTFSGMMEDWR